MRRQHTYSPDGGYFVRPETPEISLEAGMNQSTRFRGSIDFRVGGFVVVVVRLSTTEGQEGVPVIGSEVTPAGVGAVDKAISDWLRIRIPRGSQDSLKIGEDHSLLAESRVGEHRGVCRARLTYLGRFAGLIGRRFKVDVVTSLRGIVEVFRGGFKAGSAGRTCGVEHSSSVRRAHDKLPESYRPTGTQGITCRGRMASDVTESIAQNALAA
jgi:hypothetical protein